MRIRLTEYKNGKRTISIEISNPTGLNEYWLMYYNEISPEEFDRTITLSCNPDYGGMHCKLVQLPPDAPNVECMYVLTPTWIKAS